jgi:hypothetical protein
LKDDPMDKIVKHRFWILLALVPPLVVFGYYKANGAIIAAKDARIAALEAAFTAIPKGDGPNPTWVKAADGGIEIYNEAIAKAVNVEKVRVWTDQLPRMTWPAEMEPYVPRTPQGDMIYRGPFVSDAGYTYKAEYNPDLLEALYQSIEPLKQERDGGVSGKVQVSRNIIPHHTFADMLVTSESIWDAQEDLWLLQLLFDAIRNTNRPAENAAKSAVRRLNMIRLMGGDGQSTVRSMGATGAVGGADGARLGMDVDNEDASIGIAATMMGRGGAMGIGQRTNVNFDPSEEFGVGFEGMGVAGGATSPDDVGFGGRARDIDNDMGTAVAGGTGLGRKEIRYIAYTDGAPFRERGFYMSVLIDQKKIADFLVELSNADWPIRIVRFNVGPNPGGTGVNSGYTPGLAGGKDRAMDEDEAGMTSMLGANFGGAVNFGGGANFGQPGAGAFGDPTTGAGSGFTDDLFTNPLTAADETDPRGMGLAGGAYGPSPMVRGDQIQSLFTHPDLVQLDLCGVITMYNPPDAALIAAVTGTPPAATAPAADASAAPAGDAAAGEAPADAGAAQPAAPGPETVDPAAAAPEAGASSDPAATPEAGVNPEPAAPAATDSAAPGAASDAPAEPPAADAPADAGTAPAPGA